MKRTLTGILLTLMMLALVGCGGTSLLPNFDPAVDFDPSAIGFEVTPDGIIVASHVVTFTAKAGSMGGWIDGYRIEYFDRDGDPLRGTPDNELQAQGSVGVYVNPGIRCPAEAESPVPCSVNSEGAQYAPGIPTQKVNLITLDEADVLYLVGTLNQTGDYADVYFQVTDDNNGSRELGPYRVALVNPVGSG